MAVAFETSLAPTARSFLEAGEAETVAFDAGSGANRVLLVCVGWRDRDNAITSVTYNGVAMSIATTGTKVEESGVYSGQLWALANPASGTNNIVVTMGLGAGGDSPAQICAWVGNGADISGTPFDGYSPNNGNGASANITSTATVASASGDMIVVFHMTRNLVGNITATPTNYTERQDAADGTGLSIEFGDAAGAASVATTATWSNGAGQVEWVALGINVNADAGGGGTVASTSRMTTLGVGR